MRSFLMSDSLLVAVEIPEWFNIIAVCERIFLAFEARVGNGCNP